MLASRRCRAWTSGWLCPVVSVAVIAVGFVLSAHAEPPAAENSAAESPPEESSSVAVSAHVPRVEQILRTAAERVSQPLRVTIPPVKLPPDVVPPVTIPPISIPRDVIRAVSGEVPAALPGAFNASPSADQTLPAEFDLPNSRVRFSEAHYTAQVNGGYATIDCRWIVHVKGEKPAEVTCNLGEAAVGTLSSKTNAYLKGLGNGRFTLVLQATGRQEVNLSLMAAVHSAGQQRSAGTEDNRASTFALSCPPAPRTTLEVVVPEENQHITVSPTLIPQSVEHKAGESRVKGRLTTTSRIAVAWREKKPVAAPQKPLVTVENHTRLKLQKSRVRAASRLLYRVHRGQVSELRLVAPPDARVLDVTCPQKKRLISGWEATRESTQQLITISLSKPVQTAIDVHVYTQRPRSRNRADVQSPKEPETTGFTVPVAGIDNSGVPHGVHARNAVRETGLLAITSEPPGVIRAAKNEGWMAVTPREVPAALRSDGARYFRYFRTDRRFEVTLRPRPPRMTVHQKMDVTLQRDKAAFRSTLHYENRGAPASSLAIQLPADVTIDGVTCDSLQSFEVDTSPSPPVLRVRLKSPMKGNLVLKMEGHRSCTTSVEKATPVTLPLLKPQGVLQQRSDFQVRAAPGLHVSADGNTLSVSGASASRSAPATRGLSPQALPETTSVTKSLQDEYETAGRWSFEGVPESVAVRVRRLPARLTARVDSTLDFQTDKVKIATDVAFHVQNVSRQVFRFSVPREALHRLRVTDSEGQPVAFRRVSRPKQPESTNQPENKAPLQKQREREATPDTENTWIPLEVHAPEPVLGSYRLTVHYAIDMSGLTRKDGKDPMAVCFEPLRVLDAASVTEATDGDQQTPMLSAVDGRVLLLPSRKLFSKVVSDGSDILPATDDDRDGERDESGEDGGRLFEYRKQPSRLTLQLRPQTVQPPADPIISRGLVEISIATGSTADYRCRYRIANRRQNRLQIRLPQTAEPLAVVIDGQEAALQVDPSAKQGKQGEEPQEGWRAYLLDLPRSTESATENASRNLSPEQSAREISLVVQYRLPLRPPSFESSIGRLQLHLPQIAAEDGTPAVVGELRTAVWSPRRYRLFGRSAGFSHRTGSGRLRFRIAGPLGNLPEADDASARQSLNAWIGIAAPDEFRFPQRGRRAEFEGHGEQKQLEVAYIDMWFATWALSLPVLLIGVVLARTSWQNKLSIGLLSLFGLTLIAMRYPDEVYHGLLAARYGLAGVAVWWVVHGVYGLHRREDSVPDTTGSSQKPAMKPQPCPLPVHGLRAVVIPPPGTFVPQPSPQTLSVERIPSDRTANAA